MDICSIRREI